MESILEFLRNSFYDFSYEQSFTSALSMFYDDRRESIFSLFDVLLYITPQLFHEEKNLLQKVTDFVSKLKDSIIPTSVCNGIYPLLVLNLSMLSGLAYSMVLLKFRKDQRIKELTIQVSNLRKYMDTRELGICMQEEITRRKVRRVRLYWKRQQQKLAVRERRLKETKDQLEREIRRQMILTSRNNRVFEESSRFTAKNNYRTSEERCYQYHISSEDCYHCSRKKAAELCHQEFEFTSG